MKSSRGRKVLRFAGLAVAAVAAVAVGLVGALYAWAAWRLNRHYEVPVAAVTIPSDAAALRRGEHLANNVSLCSHCHGKDFGGTPFFNEDAMIATLPAPNLTRGKGGIGASYSDADWVRAIRHGVRPNGRPLIYMPAGKYQHLSAEDLGAIVAYVKSRPAVDREWPAGKLGPLGRVFLFLDTELLLPVTAVDHTAPVRPTAPPPSDVLARGEHLVRVAGCQGCHKTDLTGGGGPPPGAANITPAGVGHWNETDFVRAIRTGIAPGQRELSPSMPREYGAMTDAELHAIWTYLRSVEPKGEKSARQQAAALSVALGSP